MTRKTRRTMTMEERRTNEPIVEDTSLRSRFPLLDKLLRCNDPVRGWEKFLWGIYFLPVGILTFVVDCLLWLIVNALREIKYIWRKIFDVIVEKFIGKVLLMAAIAISGFFIYFLIKSGTWQNLFDFCSSLFA